MHTSLCARKIWQLWTIITWRKSRICLSRVGCGNHSNSSLQTVLVNCKFSKIIRGKSKSKARSRQRSRVYYEPNPLLSSGVRIWAERCVFRGLVSVLRLGRPSESRCVHTAERLHYRSCWWPIHRCNRRRMWFRKDRHRYLCSSAQCTGTKRLCADVRRIQGQTHIRRMTVLSFANCWCCTSVFTYESCLACTVGSGEFDEESDRSQAILFPQTNILVPGVQCDLFKSQFELLATRAVKDRHRFFFISPREVVFPALT